METVPELEVLSTQPRAVLKTVLKTGTVSSLPYTDRPRPVNDVFIFSPFVELERGGLV